MDFENMDESKLIKVLLSMDSYNDITKDKNGLIKELKSCGFRKLKKHIPFYDEFLIDDYYLTFNYDDGEIFVFSDIDTDEEIGVFLTIKEFNEYFEI